MNSLPVKSICLLTICVCFMACNAPIGVFEKNVSFKKQEWQSSYKPEYSFNITDTTAAYNIFLVIRHTDAYSYNNIWLRFTRTGPDTSYAQQVDLRLADNTHGWYGNGMDDIWEHRVPITHGPTQFRKRGTYQFTLEQIMRQDPLLHILNAGLRVEKAP